MECFFHPMDCRPYYPLHLHYRPQVAVTFSQTQVRLKIRPSLRTAGKDDRECRSLLAAQAVAPGDCSPAPLTLW